MKYKKSFEEIMKQLTTYKIEVDELAIAYVTEKTRHEKELQKMQGKYTESYISEERKNWRPIKNYAEEISTTRQKHQKVALQQLNNIKSEMDNYFCTPVDSSFASTVVAIKTLGLNLTNREFDLLQEKSNGYLGRRLLNELAVSRMIEVNKVKLNETNNSEQVRIEEPKPFNGVSIPDIEQAYNSLQNVKNAINTAFEGYALKDVIFPIDKVQKETNVKLSEVYGIQPQKPTLDNLTISKMASSIKCFDKNYIAYTTFLNIMNEISATIPKPKKKTRLTDSDKKLIDTLIDSKYPVLAQGEAIKIARADNRLAEILQLDSRYKTAVTTALNEANNNE